MGIVTVYSLRGHTTAGKWVCVSHCTSPDICKTIFAKKYPRFRGIVNLESTEAEELGNDLLVINAQAPRFFLAQYKSRKEILKS